MRYTALLLLTTAAFAAVEGTVTNRTTGKPQAGATVSMLNLGTGGMRPTGSVKTDAQGRFRFEQNLDGPALLQVFYGGVTYNHQVQPGGATGHELSVYETSKQPGAAKVAQHMLVLEPAENQLNVSETFFFSNEGNTTFHDAEAGTLRFFVPKGANPPSVMVTGPQGMPIQREAKTREAGVYAVDFPIRPGETRFDVRYTVPFTTPGVFAGKSLYHDVTTRFAVPNGVTLAGEGLKQLGQEPSTQASIYETTAAAYKLTVEGTGSLQAAAAPADDEEAGPQIQRILPPVYERAEWIIAAALVALACGFVMLYRRGATQ